MLLLYQIVIDVELPYASQWTLLAYAGLRGLLPHQSDHVMENLRIFVFKFSDSRVYMNEKFYRWMKEHFPREYHVV